MRLIFTSLASHGHVHPLLPLALAAREAGHDVLFATGAEFLAIPGHAGLDVTQAGLSLREARALAGTEPGAKRSEAKLAGQVARAFGEILPRQAVRDLVPLFDDVKPDLIIYESGNTGAGLAARLTGVPAVCHGFGRYLDTPVFRSVLHLSPALAAEFGVEISGDFALGNHYLDICPTSMQSAEFVAGVRARRSLLRPVAWNVPGSLPPGVEERDGRRPLVYLTLGTMMGTVDAFRQAIAGLARLPVDVIVATGPTVGVGDLGEVPPQMLLREWVPQAELLAEVDLVVHHGGSGTTYGALTHGLPQLLIPHGADQFINAEVLLEAGAVGRILPTELSADAVADQVRRLLVDESVRAAAARLAAEIAAMPSPKEVAQRLPEFAR